MNDRIIGIRQNAEHARRAGAGEKKRLQGGEVWYQSAQAAGFARGARGGQHAGGQNDCI